MNQYHRFRLPLFLLPLLAFLLPAIGPAAGSASPNPAPGGRVITGRPVPDFTLDTMEGEHVQLSAMKDRKVVLLVLWAVWCPPCIDEIPRLNQLYERYRERGLEILGVGVPYGQDEKGIRSFIKKNSVSYPLLFDGEDVVSDSFGAIFVPQNYLIAGDGTLAYEGNSLPEDIDSRIENLLNVLPGISATTTATGSPGPGD